MISVLKVNKRSNSSDIREKAIPQMHPSVVQTMIVFLLVQGLGRANLFSIFLSANNVAHAEEVWVLWNLVIYTL